MRMYFKYQSYYRIAIVVGFVMAVSYAVAVAQIPPDAPILISESGSTRALVARSAKRVANSASKIIPPGTRTRLTFFITNLDLMENEGVNAFRADAETAARRRYPLEIESLHPTAERAWVYALTVQLNPNLRETGDVLVRVTWRGVASNRVRLSIGREGAGNTIPDDPGAAPTPMPERHVSKTENQSNLVIPIYSGDRIRFLAQATFGTNAQQEARVQRIGIRPWLAEQFEQKYDQTGVERFSTFPYPDLPLMPTDFVVGCQIGGEYANCIRDNYTMYRLQNWFHREALYGEDQQLRRRVAWALSQIFVVSGRQTVQPSRMVSYLKTLDKNAFGNYRNLLLEITLNPAMGNYLDMARSTVQNPNENYAREILQLFSIGVDKLNQDGTPILDSNNRRIATYDQNVVNGFTKVFTGWTFCNSSCANSQPGIINYRDPLILNDANHDASQKTLLSYPGAVAIVPSGQTAVQDLNQAIDNVFNHPNVAPFVGKILIQQLVTSNPTPAYVARVAAVFNDNGQGVRGDLKAVVKAILLDPEARGNLKTDPDYGHLKEPNLFVTGFMRAFKAKANVGAATGCNNQSDGVLNPITASLDQDIFNSPTVFNYYRLNYSIPNLDLAGPEFAIMTTGTTLKRANFVNRMIFGTPTGGNTVVGIPSDSTGAGCGTTLDLTDLRGLARTDPSGGQLVDALNRQLLNGSMSLQMRDDVLTAVQAVSASDSLKRARTAVYLVATSSQYQVQR